MRRLWKDFYCLLKPVLPQDDSCKGKISFVKSLNMNLPPDKTPQVFALHEDLPHPWWFKEPHVRYLFDVVFIHPAQSLLSWSCQTGMFTRAPGPSSVTSVTAGSVNSTTWSITCPCTWKERRYCIIQLSGLHDKFFTGDPRGRKRGEWRCLKCASFWFSSPPGSCQQQHSQNWAKRWGGRCWWRKKRRKHLQTNLLLVLQLNFNQNATHMCYQLRIKT